MKSPVHKAIEAMTVTQLIIHRNGLLGKKFLDLTPMDFEVIKEYERVVLTRYHRMCPRVRSH